MNYPSESSGLHRDECQFFQEKDHQMKRRFSEVSNSTTLSSPLWITPLRMLLKKQTDPKMFDRINMLRDHTAPKVRFFLALSACPECFFLLLFTYEINL